MEEKEGAMGARMGQNSYFLDIRLELFKTPLGLQSPSLCTNKEAYLSNHEERTLELGSLGFKPWF